MLNYNTEKVNKLLKVQLPIFCEFKFNGILFLCGGALRSIYLNEEPKDFDFVLLTQVEDNIKEFIEQYKLEYQINAYGGYKINYNKIVIDIWSVNDLYKAIRYNIDGLFYDVKNQTFIPFGFNHCFEYDEIIELNPYIKHSNENRDKERDIKRKTKLIEFFKKYKSINDDK